MAGVPRPCLIVGFDKLGSPLGLASPRCDHLCIAEGNDGIGWVVPLELKRGALNAVQVSKQLQAGAGVATELIPSKIQIRLRPVAASGSTPKAARNKLKQRRYRIRIRGLVEAVRLIPCGSSLLHALSS